MPQVERVITDVLAGLPDIVRPACERLSAAGGRRLRARLALLAAGTVADGAASEQAVAAAATVELLHLASLVHDDLLDDAPTRRGVPTANAAEGSAIALLAGNCLQAAAFDCAGPVGDDAVHALRCAVVELCEGAALEQRRRYRADLTAAQVLEVAGLKAGALLAIACQLGALASTDAATRSESVQRALGDYGRELGVALQLLDDLLDVTSTAARLGKPVETDFANGVVTLPALPALAADATLRSLLRPGLTPHERRYAVTTIRHFGGPENTLRLADEHVARARSLVGSPALQHHPAGQTLADLPHQFLAAQVRLVDRRYRPVSPCGA